MLRMQWPSERQIVLLSAAMSRGTLGASVRYTGTHDVIYVAKSKASLEVDHPLPTLHKTSDDTIIVMSGSRVAELKQVPPDTVIWQYFNHLFEGTTPHKLEYSDDHMQKGKFSELGSYPAPCKSIEMMKLMTIKRAVVTVDRSLPEATLLNDLQEALEDVHMNMNNPLPQERLLFHGTEPGFAFLIAANGFILPPAEEEDDDEEAVLKGMDILSRGVYLADDVAKADQYTTSEIDNARTPFTENAKKQLGLRGEDEVHYMIVSRVLMGEGSVQKVWRRESGVDFSGFDRVIIVPNHYEFDDFREYAIRDPSLVLPEFLIAYRRKYEGAH